MNVLITNNNIDFFKGINPKLRIQPATANTSIIKCTEKTFIKLMDEVRLKGLNPYAVMAW